MWIPSVDFLFSVPWEVETGFHKRPFHGYLVLVPRAATRRGHDVSGPRSGPSPARVAADRPRQAPTATLTSPHTTPPDSTHPQLTPEENREHTREAQRPMPEDADQDIRLRALVCLWPTTRSNRGPTELSSHAKVEELSWGLGWQYSFGQSFRRLFFCAGQRAFLGQLRALKRPESN